MTKFKFLKQYLYYCNKCEQSLRTTWMISVINLTCSEDTVVFTLRGTRFVGGCFFFYVIAHHGRKKSGSWCIRFKASLSWLLTRFCVKCWWVHILDFLALVRSIINKPVLHVVDNTIRPAAFFMRVAKQVTKLTLEVKWTLHPLVWWNLAKGDIDVNQHFLKQFKWSASLSHGISDLIYTFLCFCVIGPIRAAPIPLCTLVNQRIDALCL
jgi:hypothetical protein